jgi:hypothetical protein
MIATCLSGEVEEAGMTEAPIRSALMKTEPAREQVVVVGDLNNIVVADPRRAQKPGRALRPMEKIVFCVAHHHRFAGGAGRGMQTDDVPQRHGEHIVGIGA